MSHPSPDPIDKVVFRSQSLQLALGFAAIGWLLAVAGPFVAYLAFKTKEIPRLVRAKLLTPLGKPSRRATKYYAEVELRRLRNDPAWLHKATEVILKHWHSVYEKQQTSRKQKRCTRQSHK